MADRMGVRAGSNAAPGVARGRRCGRMDKAAVHSNAANALQRCLHGVRSKARRAVLCDVCARK